MRDAAEFGFDPAATGMANWAALQKAVADGGTVWVSRPGTYRLAGTVYLAATPPCAAAPGWCFRRSMRRARSAACC